MDIAMPINFVVKFAKLDLDYSILIRTLAFRNELLDRNFYFRGLNGNGVSTLCGNLVRFRPVTVIIMSTAAADHYLG